MDPEKTFFDLRVQPGQEQDLQVRLKNYSKQKMTLTIAVNTAYTNNNGLIEYDRTDPELNVDLSYSIHELAKVQEPEVTLNPNETKLVTIHLTIPEQPFEGLLLGGIYVRPKIDQASEKETKGKVKNIQSMVKGIRLSEKDDPMQPDLQMVKAYASQIGYRNVFLATIQNPKPVILTEVNIQASVYKKDDLKKAILTNQSKGFKIAPNSKMEYGVFLNTQLFEAGDYVMKMHVESKEGKWEFSQPLVVTVAEAQQLNEVLNAARIKKMPGWIKWIIGLSISVLLLSLSLIVFLFITKKRTGKLGK